MTTIPRRDSAKIYQFPHRLRSSPDVRPNQKAADPTSRILPEIESGSGWYHEVAVQEDRTRKS